MNPINPNTENPEALNTSPQPSNNSNGLTVLSMAIFILLSLGVIIFLYYQNQQLKNIISDYQNVQVTPISTSTPVATETASPSASPKSMKTSTPQATLKACTMEAKICPNGSSVGRTGPNCEFAPCP